MSTDAAPDDSEGGHRAPTLVSAIGAPLGPDDIARLAAYGTIRPVAAGDLLFRAGDASYDLYVILDGEVEIIGGGSEDAVVLARYGAGAFLGELNLVTGQRPWLSARVVAPGEVLSIPRDDVRHVMAALPDVADRIFDALAARRERLREGDGALLIRIVGSRFSPASLALRSFANRSRLPHRWIDVEESADPEVLLAGMGLRAVDVPAVLTPMGTLRRATPGTLAEHLGLTYQPPPRYVLDLVVVGTGPAGLAAAVYGASEGLETLSVDKVAVGGQAGASSRIENYMGFPNGISGEELTSRAAIQAQRLGARLSAPCRVVELGVADGHHVLTLEDGSQIATRAVVLATGARYRRLVVDDLERFEGSGVFYAATDLEARLCEGRDVVVVGGGNSAGQAALHLASACASVTIVVRRDDLGHAMSHYLVERIEADPRIRVRTGSEVVAVSGPDHLTEVAIADRGRRTVEQHPCVGLFCFIGADPATGWLGGSVALDGAGFVLTDRDLPDDADATAHPLPYETSVPGVFAVGDVRHGSLKRVAAAVGEGSSAIRSVHQRLAVVTA